MSVLIVTSLGDIVVDLLADRCPLTCKNFLKLCKIKYYNGCLFHTVQKDFTAQTGDPTGTGAGGDSIYKFLYGDQARFFGDEIHLDLKHSEIGTIAMASAGENLNASQFYITLRENLDSLDGNHTVFGKVAEGLETLERINGAYVDQDNRPFKNIRIKHTYVLDDPFDDPPQLSELVPDASPEGKPKDEVVDEVRLEDDWVPLDEKLDTHKLEEVLREKEAYSREVVLEAIQDIPEAGVKPPENVLFVCKLNPVTEDEDLHTIFSRFGTVTSAEIIRDYKTGDSLCYAFVEFEDEKSCEEAYFKMDNALIDDRRIHVDFSQSVMKLWSEYRGKMRKGKGCHKCGSVDHIAKDCTTDTSNEPQAHPKYVLKDDNTQYGGKDKSRYEMVFDGDVAAESPKAGKRRRYDEQQEGGKERENRRGSGIDGGKDSYNGARKDFSKDSREDRRRHGDDDDDDRKVYQKGYGDSSHRHHRREDEKRQHEKRQEYQSSRVKDMDRREYEKAHHGNDRRSRDRRREEAKGDGERDSKRDDRGNEKASAVNKESRDRRGYEKAEYSVDRKGSHKERIDEKERRRTTSEEDDDRRHERREKTYDRDRDRPRRH